jgi:holo-[acyl-carrier protein] synthase
MAADDRRMIVGIGTDLVGVARISAVYQRQGARFLDKVYSADEQDYCLSARDPAERLAARWAAKEAVMKALGTGWARGVDFRHIVVVSGTGAPHLSLQQRAAEVAAGLQIAHWHLSLSHSDGMAIAMVIAESD